MAIFKRRSENEQTNEASGNDSIVNMVARMVADVEEPIVFIGLLILELLKLQAFTVEDLSKIGITEDEIRAVLEGVRSGTTVAEVSQDLAVRAALRQYEQQLLELGSRHGVAPGTPEFKRFRAVVVAFAEENNILDLDLAYRLLRSERPGDLS